MKQHIELLGWIYLILGVLGAFAGTVVFAALIGPGIISGNSRALAILTLIGGGVGSFLFLISIPGLVAGAGLLKQKPWARILAIILAVFNLFNFPIGTAISIYTFWVMTNEESAKLLNASI